MAKRLVLLMNIGSPKDPSFGSVARYLGEFLTDPKMLTIPAPIRYGLVYGIIVPTRSSKTAHAYSKVWTKRGSPLVVQMEDLCAGLQKKLPDDLVRVAMRYGQSYRLKNILQEAKAAGVSEIVALPMFPQFSEAATGSALAELDQLLKRLDIQVPVKSLNDFYDHPDFIRAQGELILEDTKVFKPDHILMSYHGLPENHVKATDQTGQHCLAKKNCCDEIVDANRNCYRAQSFATSRALAKYLGLKPDQYSVSFQSRLGRTPWIQPFTDKIIQDLRDRGIKKLLVVCPSFVSDCLETLEEIGMRCKEDWMAIGGEELHLTSCVNSSELFVDFLEKWAGR